MNIVRLILILISIHFFSFNARSNPIVQIDLKIQMEINYFPPFQNYANASFKELVSIGTNNFATIDLKMNRSGLVKFVFDKRDIDLFYSPNDTIRITVYDSPDKNREWISFNGNNAPGHHYYNLIYNQSRIEKFYKIRDVFEANYLSSVSELRNKTFDAIESQMKWIDSLRSQNLISDDFLTYLKVEVEGLLAWQLVDLSVKYLERIRPDLRDESIEYQTAIFDEYSPDNPILPFCFSATGYLGFYYRYLFETGKKINEADAIVDDVKYFVLAPSEIQEFLWGFSVFSHYKYNPNMIENCTYYKRYKAKFPNSPYLIYFEKSNICENKPKKLNTVIEAVDMDLFSTLNFYFNEESILIDIWATWCAPCKIEFKSYNDELLNFLKAEQIGLLFISIDDKKNHERWINDIERFNLGGKHLMAGERLVESLKDIVFDNSKISIPRYVLVIRGKIVSVNFLRPSHDDFKRQLLEFIH